VDKPVITTAIPLRRYRLGEFTLTVLGDIESPDDCNYRYFMAVIRSDDPEPGLFISAEEGEGDDLVMRIMMHDGNEVIGRSGEWRDVSVFTDKAISIVSRVLNLSDEIPYQLM